MQTETQATDTTSTAAPIVDVNAPPAAAAPASAAATDASTVDTSTTTAPAGEEGSTQQEDQARDDKGQFKSGTQKRIDALIFQRHQAEREAAYWKQQAQAATPAPAPKPTDFATDDDYEDAMQQHRIDTGVSRGMSKTAEQHAERFSQQAQSAAAETYQQRVTEVAARIPDWKEVVGKSDAPLSPALREALFDSEKGPELVYHLAKNPAEAERLNAMNVRQMDREIGRLESTFGTKPAPQPPAARTTSAPAPIKPGSPASAPANTDPNKMDQASFEAWAKANGSKYIR